FVVSKNSQLDAETLRAWCKKELTAYKVPKYIEFRDELPKTNVGKVLRRQLRDQQTTHAPYGLNTRSWGLLASRSRMLYNGRPTYEWADVYSEMEPSLT
ncbi:MAG: hypothetical protein VYB20_10260, partial [Pseudomonadota bacterium]|nr:hypothetical protein [Pseudomonadota bacterium]